MNGVEELGLLKMDFLGLRTLSIIDEALRLIETSTGTAVDIDAIPLDDEKTFRLLQAGDSLGVFQLESAPMRSLMRSLAPTVFDDVAALVALYRPGPMAANMHNDYADRKNGRKPIDLPHADLDEILTETYGLMIYQESVMRVAQRIAGYTLAEADDLRKACGKKDRKLIAEQRVKFVDGTVASGYDEQLGTRLFDIIEPFADYAFNKSHAFGYGLISYQTAFLKSNYRVQFMAAVLTGVKHNLDKAGVYLNDCRQANIVVEVPDINRSEVDFAAKDSRIPFGLSAVRNVGEGVVSPIVEERSSNGDYKDFYDFCERVPIAVLNKRSLEALIKAGAFESCGHSRQGLLGVAEQIVDQISNRRKEADMGIQTLFGELDANTDGFDEKIEIPDAEVDQKTMLAWEKEMLGLYVSSHPLYGVEASLRQATDCSIADAPNQPQRDDGKDAFLTLGGVVSNLQRKFTRAGDAMAVFELEDLQSSIEVTVFPRTMSEHGHQLDDDAVLLVGGRIDNRDDEPKFLANRLTYFEPKSGPSELRLTIPSHQVSDKLVADLKALLSEHPGDTAVFLHLGKQTVRLPDDFRVNPANGLAGELRVLLGPEAVLA